MGVNELTHRTGAMLVGWTRVRPATHDPWSYDHHDPATRAAERAGVENRDRHRRVTVE